MKDVSELFRNL